MQLLSVINNHETIIKTNYWESEYASAGYVYLSINAGGYRLLIPPALQPAVREMAASTACVISRGPWPAQDRADAMELLFEDGSDSPYCLHIVPQQLDRLPTAADQGWKGKLLVYTKGLNLEFTRPVYYRQVKELPCLASAPASPPLISE